MPAFSWSTVPELPRSWHRGPERCSGSRSLEGSQEEALHQRLGFASQYRPTSALSDRERAWCALLVGGRVLLPRLVVGWVCGRTCPGIPDVIVAEGSWDQQSEDTSTTVLLDAVD